MVGLRVYLIDSAHIRWYFVGQFVDVERLSVFTSRYRNGDKFEVRLNFGSFIPVTRVNFECVRARALAGRVVGVLLVGNAQCLVSALYVFARSSHAFFSVNG